jgi:hypothetical protein
VLPVVRRTLNPLLALTLLASCVDLPTTPTPTDAAPDLPDVDLVGGDLACVNLAPSFADPALQVAVTTQVIRTDFETNVELPAGSSVDVWDGEPVGAPRTVVPDEAGLLTGVEMTQCAPTTLLSHADSLPSLARVQQVPAAETVSLPTTDAPRIESLFAAAARYRNGAVSVILGSVYGCGRTPYRPATNRTEALSNAVIVVRNAAGEVMDEAVVLYLDDDDVRRSATMTQGGRFAVVGVPVGLVRIEAWGRVEGQPRLLGAAELESVADATFHADVYAGSDDGWKVPVACLPVAEPL